MGMFMRRFGYKIGIHVGLALFSIGKSTIRACMPGKLVGLDKLLCRSDTLLAGSGVSWPAHTS